MNAITKVKSTACEVRDCIIKKAVPLSVAAVGTANALMVTAFAADGGSTGVDISSVTTSMTSSLTDLVSKAALACAGVVGAGLTIFGLKWVVQKVIGFFKAIGH